MRRTMWIAGALALAGCGSSAVITEAALDGTSGGEAPIACSVPGSPEPELFDRAMQALAAGSEDAPSLLEQACEAGNACGCTALGGALLRGQLVPHDPDRGVELLERACAGSDDEGCYGYATAIWQLHAGDVARAREAYETACGNGHVLACLELGRFHMSGIGGAASPERAAELYERACRDGVHFGCYLRGQALLAGLGVERDESAARESLQWACETAGVAEACTAAAALLPDARTALLTRACEGGEPFACDALDPEAAGRTGTAADALEVGAGATVDLDVVGGREMSTTIGGDVDLSTLGLRPACVGFVRSAPSATFRVPAGVSSLSVVLRADADTVIAVRDPAGRWHCADDPPGGAYHASLAVPAPAEGAYAVWGGLFGPGSAHAQLRAQAHGGPRVAPELQGDAIAIGRRVMRHYQLQATYAPGVAGRVRVDGHDVFTLTPEGGMLSSNLVQCILGAGRHAIEIDVTSVDPTAVALGGAPLVRVDLHGVDRPADPGDTTRAARIDWSPDAPANRSFAFELARNQAGDRATCGR